MSSAAPSVQRVSAADINVAGFLATLQQWVSVESPSQDSAAVNAMQDQVAALAGHYGFKVTRQPGPTGYGDILTISAGQLPSPTQKGILLLAHVDTVHAKGTLAKQLPWRQEGDRLYGPGIYDMKSGALMALEALRLARSCGDGPALPVTIMYVPDEEIGSPSSRAAIEQAASLAHYALVVEPARDGGKVVKARKGTGIYDVTVKGRAAHAGTRPQDGRSAIHAAALLILELEGLSCATTGVTVTVGMISGGTGRNTVPAECQLKVDARLPDAASAERINQYIMQLSSDRPDISVTVSGGLGRPAFAPSPAGDRLLAHAHELAHQQGYDMQAMLSGGGSDGNFTAALGVATLDGLGPDGEGAHTFGECIYPHSIAPRLAVLTNLLLTLGR